MARTRKDTRERAWFIAAWLGAMALVVPALYAAFAPAVWKEPEPVRYPPERLMSKDYVSPFVIDMAYLRELDERDARKRPRVATTAGRARKER